MHTPNSTQGPEQCLQSEYLSCFLVCPSILPHSTQARWCVAQRYLLEFPSSVTVSEPQFLNQENDDNAAYGFLGWCEDTANTCTGHSILYILYTGHTLYTVAESCG